MVSTILGALLPMLVTFLLGFFAAWRRDFGPKDASTLNRMVLVYAVPLALFAGTVTTSRAALVQDVSLVIALCAAIVSLYGAVFLLCRFVFHFQPGRSALAALTASAPAVPFVGPAVLGDLFGGSSAIPIAISSLVINLTVVPVTLLILALGATAKNNTAETASAVPGEKQSSSAASQLSLLASKLGDTVKEPIVWAPVLAFVFVLCGLHIPKLLIHSIAMLGSASGGVAMFACGIVLAAGKIEINKTVLSLVLLKNILQPALVLIGLRWIGYGDPIVSEAVLTTAIPTMPLVIMFAMQYRIEEGEAASAVFLSVVGSVVSMGIFIALTK
jgi:malonate transporter and related proteins